MTEKLTGGCQCGAIRFRARSLKENAHICHCRMCQKAAGNLFMAVVGVEHEDFSWTRGVPAEFRSSEKVARGFCARCGTPLFYRHDEARHIVIAIGAFDRPEAIPLRFQIGMEGRLPQLDQIAGLRNEGTTEEDDPGFAAAVRASNNQHPDHDTDRWPPEPEK